MVRDAQACIVELTHPKRQSRNHIHRGQSMLRMSLIVALMLQAATLFGDTTRAPGGVLGYWERPTKAVLRFYPCGHEVCGMIVRLSPTSGRKTDSRNPDASLRSRPLCGLDIGTGFQQADANHLVGGRLYDPVSGKTYSGMATSEGDEVKLRGYVGFSWFGKSEVWRRVGAVRLEDCR
jgi:uncharacterized protein (DUF2147 family)